MKAKIVLVLIATAAIAGAFLIGRLTGHKHAAAEGGAAQEANTLYTCGMHPNVIQDEPGNCPICEMKLTPIKRSTGAAASGERRITHYKSTMIPGEVRDTPGKDSMGMDMVPVYEGGAAMGASTISIDPVTIQNMGIRTGVVTNGPLRRVIRTVGTIDYNETALADVTTKFKGWIEKLYLDSTGQQVHRGDPLFEIYSPELYSAQREYLLTIGGATSSDPSARESLLESARLKLRFFDISDEQIAELERSRELKKTLRVGAPIDGFVTEKMVVEGMMVDAGMKLYRLANLGLVWVYAEIYEQDLPFIRLGQEATVKLSYLADRQFRGRVTYIYPTLNEKTRTVRVRMEFHNPGFVLKPGMFASVELRSEIEPSALLVSDMAVLRSGTKNTVFVALESGQFKPRTVTLGPRSEDNMYQVLSGLHAGERVVTSGQFMLDSESQLREAIQKMLNPGGPAETAAHAEHVEAAPPVPLYTCPMESHAHIVSDQPGRCPECEMKLVEASKVAHGKQSEALWLKTHPQAASGKAIDLRILCACPMPSHAHVVSDQPGKCPECEMTLVETSRVSHRSAAEENWRRQNSAVAPTNAAPQHQH